MKLHAVLLEERQLAEDRVEEVDLRARAKVDDELLRATTHAFLAALEQQDAQQLSQLVLRTRDLEEVLQRRGCSPGLVSF